jgi:ribosomal protein S18 acetylase RimI-like enzyme
MEDNTGYTVFSIPAIPGQHHIVQYKDLRLQAVQSDPHCFSSTPEKEISLTYEQWKARLQSRDKITIIAAATLLSTERLSWQYKWVGTVTVLGPNVLRQFGFVPPKTLAAVEGGKPGSHYLYVGLWVHPSHRGKGLAKRMISAGIDWIRADDAQSRRTAFLQVARNNHAAINLYASLGFLTYQTDEEDPHNDVWTWMGLDIV